MYASSYLILKNQTKTNEVGIISCYFLSSNWKLKKKNTVAQFPQSVAEVDSEVHTYPQGLGNPEFQQPHFLSLATPGRQENGATFHTNGVIQNLANISLLRKF